MSKDDRELIERLRELLAKGTTGPWSHEEIMGSGGYTLVRDGISAPQSEVCHDVGNSDDARLIVAAVNALPALLTRLEALQAQPVGEESGWLIEMVEPDHNKSPVPRWWHPEHGWTWDANKALRFAREIDAQDYILGSGRLPGKPTEHMFLDSAGGEA